MTEQAESLRRRISDKRWYLPIVLLNPAVLLASYGAMLALGRRRGAAR